MQNSAQFVIIPLLGALTLLTIISIYDYNYSRRPHRPETPHRPKTPHRVATPVPNPRVPPHEKYRPQLHFSPATGWMNDPNGLIYHKGVYHLFFQYWPYDTKWGPMHWGHTISKDLFHWKRQPIALYPQGKEFIFSGSVIIDENNVTGLQTTPNKTMIAIFTAHTNPEFIEKQWMAYSNDDGLKWDFYDNNPIIASDPKLKDFRDPKVLRFKNIYVIVLVATDHIQIYNSPNLKEWSMVSTFGKNEGSHQGVWESPDLFPINVTINGIPTEKWVLLISTGETTNTSFGPNMQYYIGSFDGRTFKNDNPRNEVLWIDYGPDSYAGVTYESAPSDRRIFMAWMNRWDYANDLNKLGTNRNGQMSLPRDLSLITSNYKNGPRILMSSLPVPEIESLRITSIKFNDRSIRANTILKINDLTEIHSNLLDIEVNVDMFNLVFGDSFGFEFRGTKDSLRVYYNDSYVIDRSNAGRHDFSEYFGLVYIAPRLTIDSVLSMRIVLDVSSVELFADQGLTSMTSLFFSDHKLNSNISLFFNSIHEKKNLKIIDLNIHQMSGSLN